MSANKELVRRYFDAINAKDVSLANRMVAKQCTIHSGGKTHPYAEALRAEQAGWKENPNRKYVIDELIAEGDKVAARWTMMNDGRTPTVEMLSIWHVHDGKFTRGEHGLFRQHS